MHQAPVATIAKHFSALEDLRRYTNGICAAICGADDWMAVEAFGHAKRKWLKQFLELPHGIPSHDTFGRVFALLNAKQFQRRFIRWIRAVYEVTQGQIVAIDGKRLRRSHDKTLGKNAIHIVSAWATENELVLGQVKTDEKSNEITVIPQLLAVLEISGCIVTLDAIGCQKKIAQQIIDQGGDSPWRSKKIKRACMRRLSTSLTT